MEEQATNPAGQADDAGSGKTAEAPPAPGTGSQQPEADRNQYDELHDRYLRLAADFENFRKRTERDKEQITRYANEQFALDMLEIVDNLERAERSDDSHIREGLEQIRKLAETVLHRHGIVPMESLGKAFDPAEHEAIAHVPSGEKEGTIIDETARGYRMHDKVIRYAKVAVSKGNEKEEPKEPKE